MWEKRSLTACALGGQQPRGQSAGAGGLLESVSRGGSGSWQKGRHGCSQGLRSGVGQRQAAWENNKKGKNGRQGQREVTSRRGC